MVKKRKDPPKAGTLLDFFSNSTPAKKGKLSTPTQTTTTRRKENLKLKVGVASSIPSTREIIVIDSESDDDVIVCDTTKTKGKAPDSANRPVKGKTVANTARVKSYEERVSFGEPTALLLPTANPASIEFSLRQSPCRAESNGSTMFGAAGSLLSSAGPTIVSNAPLAQTKDAVTDSFQHAADESNTIHIMDVDGEQSLPPDSLNISCTQDEVEEWGVDDEEQAALQAFDEDIDMEIIDEQLATPCGIESTTCPICRRDLSNMISLDVQNHVNGCIDDTAGSTSSAVEPTRPPPAEDHDQPSDRLYSVLMSSHKENEVWKEAAVMESRTFRPTKGDAKRRKAPFYKVLQGMPIAVDAFRYGTIPGVTAYFLTHAHSDHYTNLSSNWKSGPIYCSEDTANLIIHMLAVDPKWVNKLPMDTPTVIPNTEGVSVTLIEANHCPGSCLFFFEGQQTVNAGDSAFKSSFVGSTKIFRYLHCGDFRASPRHVLHPAVKGRYIDHIYLDTTYLDHKYTFPPQPLVISACAELARRIVSGEAISPADSSGKRMLTMDTWISAQPKKETKKEGEQPPPQQRMLVVVGTYSIGKERIVKAIAQALKTKIYCDARKAALLQCQSDPELQSLLTSDPVEGGVHVLPLGMIVSDKIKPYVQRFKGTYSRAVAFRPTGWTYTPPAGSEQTPTIASIISRGQARSFSHVDLKPMQKSSYAIQMYGVPYSEHSSFFELTCFAMSCEWGRMIATVNVGSENSRAKMAKWVERWEGEKKRSKEHMVKYREIDYW